MSAIRNKTKRSMERDLQKEKTRKKKSKERKEGEKSGNIGFLHSTHFFLHSSLSCLSRCTHFPAVFSLWLKRLKIFSLNSMGWIQGYPSWALLAALAIFSASENNYSYENDKYCSSSANFYPGIQVSNFWKHDLLIVPFI